MSSDYIWNVPELLILGLRNPEVYYPPASEQLVIGQLVGSVKVKNDPYVITKVSDIEMLKLIDVFGEILVISA